MLKVERFLAYSFGQRDFSLRPPPSPTSSILAKLVAIVVTASFLTGALCFDSNDATAQARLIVVDRPITKGKNGVRE
jgi:hypothetical protein